MLLVASCYRDLGEGRCACNSGRNSMSPCSRVQCECVRTCLHDVHTGLLCADVCACVLNHRRTLHLSRGELLCWGNSACDAPEPHTMGKSTLIPVPVIRAGGAMPWVGDS